MTDDELERRLWAHYAGIEPGSAPARLTCRIADALDQRASEPSFPVRLWPAVAAACALAAIVALGLVFGLRPGGFLASSGASPTVPASQQPGSPSPSPARPTSQASGISVRPTPLPAGPDVQAAGLIDALHGWAVTGQRLLVTANGGSTWRDVTPPAGFSSSDLAVGVEFVDRQHGWVAAAEPFKSGSDPTYGRIDVWRTSDGGLSWTTAQLPPAVLNRYGEILPPVQFDFLDAAHGFAFLSGNLAKGANDSDLYWTADGGRTWSADRPTGTGHVGIEGTVAFAGANDGVIVNALHGSGIAVTHDGGRTWSDASLAGLNQPSGTQLFFGQPAFFDGLAGLVAIDFQLDSSSVFRVYRTLDAGSSWTTTGALPAGVSAIAFLDQRRWIGFSGSGLVATVDGGGTWGLPSPAVGLPAAPDSLLMADPQDGWALVGMNVCLTFKSNCSSRTGLYRTVDGGLTWTQLEPR